MVYQVYQLDKKTREQLEYNRSLFKDLEKELKDPLLVSALVSIKSLIDLAKLEVVHYQCRPEGEVLCLKLLD